MQRIPIDSITILSMGYNPSERVLELEYRDTGDVYQYLEVPLEEYEAFQAAESKGTYLNKEFKKKGYRYRRLKRS
ncbi:MAG TPA: KTSC domain-containing protein [Candidatus Angelobacter sp.]|nr:KTSC domain-containing protein [Candidatus Angelobacter sp.]